MKLKCRRWALTTMDETRELSVQMESPFGAPAMVEKGCAEGIPNERWRQNTDREATRYLAAATQLSISYAETVVARVMREPFRALAPTFGVDVPVVITGRLRLCGHVREETIFWQEYSLSRYSSW